MDREKPLDGPVAQGSLSNATRRESPRGAVNEHGGETFEATAERARVLEASLRSEGDDRGADELAAQLEFCRRLISDAP